MDRILLQGLICIGRHGVTESERAEPQPFVVDVEMSLDFRRAAELDDIRETVDYAVVARHVKRIVEKKSFNLVESLANGIADQLLKRYPIEAVTVRVGKPRATLGMPGSYPMVELTRAKRRDDG